MYCRLPWSIFRDQYEVYRINMPGDGHCMMHSVAFSIFKPYRTGEKDGKAISKFEIVKTIRNDLADRLERIDPDTGKRLYDVLGNGNLASLGKADPDHYSLESLQSLLRSSRNLGEEIISALEYILEINILVLDGSNKDVVKRKRNVIYKKSIVLYFSNRHYDVITVKRKEHNTIFDANDPFIEMLEERIK